MSIQACAELVRIGDPDRFLSAMTAPPAQRGALFVLYAFNLELARAPYMSSEPLIGEMRLQFWRDVIDDATRGKSRAHEVASPLSTLIQEKNLPVDKLWIMVDARQWHIYFEQFENKNAFSQHISDTNAILMDLAAYALGGSLGEYANTVGYVSGLANWYLSTPAMIAAGKKPTFEGHQPDILAQKALEMLGDLGAASRAITPALRAGWMAKGILKKVAKDPQRIYEGTLMPSEFSRRAGLLWKQITASY